jgi:hypothetical protein
MSNLKRFNLEDYKTGKFSVELHAGGDVEIVAIDEARDTVFGFYDDHNTRTTTATNWDLNGLYYGAGSDDARDLFIRPKATVLHVNITSNWKGVLGSVISTEGQPKVYRGTKLLKYLTVEINEEV